jgi:hypothetical protein
MEKPRNKISDPIPPYDKGMEDLVFSQMTQENPSLNSIAESRVRGLIEASLSAIRNLEEIGRRDLHDFSISPDIAEKIGAVWVISGAGTYDEPFKKDPYQGIWWARYMDRARINYGTRILRKITETKEDKRHNGSISTVEERKHDLRQAILEDGPIVIYNGSGPENDTVRDVLTREGVIIPAEICYIQKEPTANTVVAIKSLHLPEILKKEIKGKEVAIVAHGPQLQRIAHIMGKYYPFGEDTQVRFFPIPTPPGGEVEYAIKEARGIVYYALVKNEAAENPHPYLLNTAFKRQSNS